MNKKINYQIIKIKFNNYNNKIKYQMIRIKYYKI